MAIFEDDRTTEEKKSHYYLIGGTDRFMSGWGEATNMPSYAFWACKPEHYNKVMSWVKNRSDIMRVRQVASSYKPARNSHTHIYVVGEGHPAIREYADARCSN